MQALRATKNSLREAVSATTLPTNDPREVVKRLRDAMEVRRDAPDRDERAAKAVRDTVREPSSAMESK